MATAHDPAPRRLLIAERGTDWLRALRSLSLSHRPFTTLVQAREDATFLRDCPWEGRAPEEILLVCGNTLTSDVLTARLALLRHVESQPGATSVRIVVDAEEGEIAGEAFLDVVRSLAPGLRVGMTSLAALAAEEGLRRAA